METLKSIRLFFAAFAIIFQLLLAGASTFYLPWGSVASVTVMLAALASCAVIIGFVVTKKT